MGVMAGYTLGGIQGDPRSGSREGNGEAGLVVTGSRLCNGGGTKPISCIITVSTTEVVSSPALHQTAEPSLLFPSMIAAFLTGSGMGESGRRSHAARSTMKIKHAYQSMGDSEPHGQ